MRTGENLLNDSVEAHRLVPIVSLEEEIYERVVRRRALGEEAR